MVKSVLGVNHRGLTDWWIQRVSALLLAVYIIVLSAYIIMHPDISYAEWHSLFAQSWVKLATILVLVSLLFHAWVGIWTILTDYVKCYVINIIIQLIILLALIAFFFLGLQILWGV
jgi:succinate dehydrogenase / fumarate reductase, membrane anchor subunit